MKIINQFAFGFYYGDGLYYHLNTLHQKYLEKKYNSKIFVTDYINSYKESYLYDVNDYKEEKKHTNILHYTNYFELNKQIAELNTDKIMDFHNVTPPEFFLKWDDCLYNQTKKAYDELPYIINKFPKIITHSEFSKKTLLELCPEYNEKNILIKPVFLNYRRYKKYRLLNLKKKIFRNKINLLFVSRLFPNKRQDILIDMMNILINKYNRKNIYLNLIGGGLEKYINYLKDKIKKYNLKNYINLPGKILKSNEIYKYYSKAHFFLCPSEHEGFCAPVIEATIYKLPIIYYMQEAVCETLNNEEIQIRKNNSELWAETILKNIN